MTIAHRNSNHDGSAHKEIPDMAGSSSSSPGPLTMPALDRGELVRRMVQDAFEQPSVRANLQLNGIDLLEMSSTLKEAIMREAESCDSLSKLERLQSLIETYVKLCRQADRILRLQHDMSKASTQ